MMGGGGGGGTYGHGQFGGPNPNMMMGRGMGMGRGVGGGAPMPMGGIVGGGGMNMNIGQQMPIRGNDAYDPFEDDNIHLRHMRSPTPPEMDQRHGHDPRERSPSPEPEPSLDTSDEPFNDCEILIMGKSDNLESYGELIEKGIKSIGLTVDLMYPKPEIKIGEFVQNLARRGTKLAVVIYPENEVRRSLSLYVLKGAGAATVLRNMPLQAAYDKMKETKKQLQREVISKIPADVQTTLQGVLENKLMTDKDYQSTIKYLLHRWQIQHEFQDKKEFDEGTGILSEDQIRQKISSILGVDENKPGSNPPLPSTSVNNPNVQEAIDNLMRSSSVMQALQSQQRTQPTDHHEQARIPQRENHPRQF